LIEPSVLEKLAERPEYPGRAILGDLLLNLALRADGHSYEPTALVKSERFWKSKWDFIELHVAELMAAKAFMGHPISLTHVSIDPKIIKDKTESFHALKRDVETLLGSSSINGQVAGLLHDYFWLGQQPDRIREIESSIRDLNEDDARELIRLLFAHPIWVVSEAAASLVTSLIERNDRLVVVVSDLLQNENWRVRYGATETACWIRHIEPTLFDDSIDRFCRDPNPNMRGLCAENLFSVILNSGKQIRDNLLTQYNEQIRYWLLDEDCWVLEHIFRFFSTLHRKHVNVEPLLSAGVSRLFDDAPGWYHRFDRGQFLRHIEAAKRRIRVNN
jgi:hypothetical protein